MFSISTRRALLVLGFFFFLQLENQISTAIEANQSFVPVAPDLKRFEQRRWKLILSRRSPMFPHVQAVVDTLLLGHIPHSPKQNCYLSQELLSLLKTQNKIP
jgi:hypothetical protein